MSQGTDAQITVETILAGRITPNGHLNYGADGSGYRSQHTTIPRLSCIDRFYKGEARKRTGLGAERLWLVDGEEVADLEEAVRRLGVPAVLTDEETAVLAHVPAEWVDLHDFRTALSEQLGLPCGQILMMLRQKGMVENQMRVGPGPGVPFVRRASAGSQ